MALVGTGPTNGAKGASEYSKHIGQVRRRVRCWIPQLKETRSTDNGFLASVMALRVLVEGAPNIAAILIAKGEVESWREAYEEWFERHKRRFPKTIDPEEVKRRALEEFARIEKIGVNKPKIIWEGDAYEDCQRAAEE